MLSVEVGDGAELDALAVMRHRNAEVDKSGMRRAPGSRMVAVVQLKQDRLPWCDSGEIVPAMARPILEQVPGRDVIARIDGLRKHVRVQHLEWVRPNEGFICPYQGCTVSLNSTMHFLSHTAREHGLHL